MVTAPPQGAVRAEEADGKAASSRWETHGQGIQDANDLASSPCSPIPRQVLFCKTGVGFEFEEFAAQCQILLGCWVKP